MIAFLKKLNCPVKGQPATGSTSLVEPSASRQVIRIGRIIPKGGPLSLGSISQRVKDRLSRFVKSALMELSYAPWKICTYGLRTAYKTFLYGNNDLLESWK